MPTPAVIALWLELLYLASILIAAEPPVACTVKLLGQQSIAVFTAQSVWVRVGYPVKTSSRSEEFCSICVTAVATFSLTCISLSKNSYSLSIMISVNRFSRQRFNTSQSVPLDFISTRMPFTACTEDFAGLWHPMTDTMIAFELLNYSVVHGLAQKVCNYTNSKERERSL